MCNFVDMLQVLSTRISHLMVQDIFNAGFAGASFGGVFCASAVLGRNVYGDLTALKAASPPSIPKK